LSDEIERLRDLLRQHSIVQDEEASSEVVSYILTVGRRSS